MTNATFTVQMGRTSSNRGDDTMHVRIEDEVSGMQLAEFQLTAEQFLKLVGGSVVSHIPGERTPFVDRLGKRMEHASVNVPVEVTQGFYKQDECRALVEEWANARPDLSDWDSLELRSTNQGWKVIARRWVEAD